MNQQPRIFAGRLTLQHISMIKQMCARVVKEDGPDVLSAMGSISSALDAFQEVVAKEPEADKPKSEPRSKKVANAA